MSFVNLEEQKIEQTQVTVEFQDYRDYLRNLFEDMKFRKPQFSYQFCAIRLRKSASYLKLVLAKKRHIHPSQVAAFFDLFQLETQEREYLSFLYLFTMAPDAPSRNFFGTVLQRFRIQDRKTV